MTFLYPLGFLGLIAVPILIIIYIIKNKYTEQVISSTYLWTLSEKFLKRRNPISKLTGIISLILQILAVVAISVGIAHPVFTLRGAASEYVFILDGSGSMNIAQGETTRFDLGKEQISSVISNSSDGSTYTLVYVGASTDIVYESIDDKDRALTMLEELDASYCSVGFADALNVAQEYFNASPWIKTYLVTDKSYESAQNVQVVTVPVNGTEGVENYALSQINVSVTSSQLKVTGNAYSYESDVDLTLKLFIDGNECGEQQVEVKKLEAASFEFVSSNVEYSSVRVEITQTDCLAEDNGSTIFNVRYDSTFKTLIVSDAPFFVQAALSSLGNTQTEVISTDKYNGESGYGLYVFDGYTPATMPKDGAVWFFNPVGNVENSGFSVQGEVELSGAGKMVYASSSSTKLKNLVKNLAKSDAYLLKYVKCGLYRSFTTVLTYDGNPLVFAGTNSYGNRQVVFAFDLHDSDFALSQDFIVLSQNLLNYTFPSIVDEASYYCGDTLQINVLPGCDSVRIDSPLGNVTYLEAGSDSVEYELTEVGVYKVTMIAGSSDRGVANVYCSLPENERFTTVSETSFILTGEAQEKSIDGKYDDLMILFILLAVIFVADWMVYCYEQYQLR
jgi:hypothetical protein